MFEKYRDSIKHIVTLAKIQNVKEVIHRGTLNRESQEPSCRISSKTYEHAEDTLFQWDY